jgi:hypothetical protein
MRGHTEGPCPQRPFTPAPPELGGFFFHGMATIRADSRCHVFRSALVPQPPCSDRDERVRLKRTNAGQGSDQQRFSLLCVTERELAPAGLPARGFPLSPLSRRGKESLFGLLLPAAQNPAASWVHKVHPSAGRAFNSMIGFGVLECLFGQRGLNRTADDGADKNQRSHVRHRLDSASTTAGIPCIRT